MLTGFGRPFQGTAPAYLQIPNFGEQQLIAYQARSIAPLWIGEAAIASAPLETWKACFFTIRHTAEEGLEGAMDSQHHILQDLRMDHRAVFPYLTNLRQFCLLLVVGDGDVPHLPRLAALLQAAL